MYMNMNMNTNNSSPPMRRNNRRRPRRKKRQQQDVVSSHYNRSRIERELDLFFGCDNDELIDNAVADGHTRTRTRTTSPPSSSSSNNRAVSSLLLSPYRSSTTSTSRSPPLSPTSYVIGSSVNQEMDPVFNLDPTPGRCDTDDFDFFSILEEGQENDNHNHNEEKDKKVEDKKDQKQNKTKTSSSNSSSSPTSPPSSSPLSSSSKKREQFKRQGSSRRRNNSSTSFDHVDVDIDNMIQSQSGSRRSSSKSKSQSQSPESDIDGFSVIEQLPTPERKMIISYTPNQLYDHNHDKPPELLTISMDSNSQSKKSGSGSGQSVSSSSNRSNKSQSNNTHISYDESTNFISSSIAFFLSANKEELHNDGLSIAAGTLNDNASHSISPTMTTRGDRDRHRDRDHKKDRRNSTSTNLLYASNVSFDDEESLTAMGYSRASSKFTTDSPRIIELRERKRFMERYHEKKYNKFPTLVEVDKFA